MAGQLTEGFRPNTLHRLKNKTRDLQVELAKQSLVLSNKALH
jgi:hypothetical protein